MVGDVLLTALCMASIIILHSSTARSYTTLPSSLSKSAVLKSAPDVESERAGADAAAISRCYSRIMLSPHKRTAAFSDNPIRTPSWHAALRSTAPLPLARAWLWGRNRVFSADCPPCCGTKTRSALFCAPPGTIADALQTLIRLPALSARGARLELSIFSEAHEQIGRIGEFHHHDHLGASSPLINGAIDRRLAPAGGGFRYAMTHDHS